jgi:hypothetical protein
MKVCVTELAAKVFQRNTHRIERDTAFEACVCGECFRFLDDGERLKGRRGLG